MSEIVLVDVERGVASPFGAASADEAWPTFTPDGRGLVFGSDRNSLYDLFERPLAGGSADVLRFSSKSDKLPLDVARSGALLFFDGEPRRRGQFVLPPDGGMPEPAGSGLYGRLSPDGRFVAVAESEGGRDEIYVRRLSGGTVRTRVSAAGGGSPAWRADGRELLYVAPDQMLMSVPWRPEQQDLDVEAARPLFRMTSAQLDLQGSFDVAPDGKIAYLAPVPQPGPPSQITVSLDWKASLPR
jgi:Tol biopolymer transport system component